MCVSFPASGTAHRVLMRGQPCRKPTPFSAILDQVYRCPVNAIFFRNRALSAAVGENGDNLLLGQNSLRVSLANSLGKGVASLFHRVSLIVGFCACEQMIWVYARRVVASVANLKLGVKWPLKMLVEITRGQAFSGPLGDHSISIWIFGSLPNPAPVLIWNKARKWVSSLNCHSLTVTIERVTHQGVR